MTPSTPQDEIRYDVLVVGGGAAGLAAAVTLGRVRRSVVVVDAGEPRNAPAAGVHGYLGLDGIAPSELLATGRDEARRYGARVIDGRVADLARLGEGNGGGFRASLADGTTLTARRVILATGVADVLPDIPGVAEQWGHGVIHCPYCHGWEVRDQRVVVIASGPAGAHQAALFRQLTDEVTLVVHEGADLDGHTRGSLTALGVTIVDEPVAELVTAGDDVAGVRLRGGTVLAADAVVVGPRIASRVDAAASLGVTTAPDPGGMGDIVVTDTSGATAVPGVYAAGNAADLRAQVVHAAAAGSRVAATINADLLAEEMATPDWDRRYAAHDQMWSGDPNATLVAEVADHHPGRALDVGCGEGADAIWLASQGWKVTAVDVSGVALERAEAAARAAGVTIEWAQGDVLSDPPAADAYDLVSVHYPALHRRRDHALDALVGAVAPGGTLLVVGHAPDGADHDEHARAHGFDPPDYIQPDDIAACLGETWQIDIHETRPRAAGATGRSPHTHDTILKARRR